MKLRASAVIAIVCALLIASASAEAPRGSITIDRYSGEIHFFRHDIVLRDAWKRADEFFDRTVKNGPHLTSSSSSATRP
jgi:hypothetical protein